MSGDVARRALQCIGTPFRLYGRTPGIALDCVGLAGFAFGLEDLPRDYTIKGEFLEKIITYLDFRNFAAMPPCTLPDPGEIALVKCGPRQQHVMVKVQDGWVHAHAGLGRVVLMAGPSPWPITAAWRINGG